MYYIYKLSKGISKNGYDLLYDFHGGTRAAEISLFIKAKIKVGYEHPLRGYVYDIKVKRKSSEKILHSVENQINLVRATGYDGEFPEKIILPELDEREKKKIFSSIFKNDKRKKVLIHISAGNEFRDWGEENFKTLINLLLNDNFLPIISGGNDAKKRAHKLSEVFSNSIINLVSRVSLLQFGAAVDMSDLFFGVDSGPMHIAASTETPIIAIFGPNIKEISGPWRKNDVHILDKELSCRPCRQRECPYNFKCIRDISPHEVFDKIRDILK